MFLSFFLKLIHRKRISQSIVNRNIFSFRVWKCIYSWESIIRRIKCQSDFFRITCVGTFLNMLWKETIHEKKNIKLKSATSIKPILIESQFVFIVYQFNNLDPLNYITNVGYIYLHVYDLLHSYIRFDPYHSYPFVECIEILGIKFTSCIYKDMTLQGQSIKERKGEKNNTIWSLEST